MKSKEADSSNAQAKREFERGWELAGSNFKEGLAAEERVFEKIREIERHKTLVKAGKVNRVTSEGDFVFG